MGVGVQMPRSNDQFCHCQPDKLHKLSELIQVQMKILLGPTSQGYVRSYECVFQVGLGLDLV